MDRITANDRGSWWLCATDAEFTARARAEQPRMRTSHGKSAFASTWDATMPRVRDGWRNPLPAVRDEDAS